MPMYVCVCFGGWLRLEDRGFGRQRGSRHVFSNTLTRPTPPTHPPKNQGADYRRHHVSHRAEAADGALLVGTALQEQGKGKDGSGSGSGNAWWDAPGGRIWRFYDLDGQGSWGEAKLRAFLEVGALLCVAWRCVGLGGGLGVCGKGVWVGGRCWWLGIGSSRPLAAGHGMR
jgi:hypothetical protein